MATATNKVMDALLGIDLGTTGIKAAVCSTDGDLLGSSYLEYPLIRPAPGVVEQDANDWWELTQRATRQALQSAAVERRCVRAMSVGSQGISFVPIDGRGKPLDNAINWLDTRATAEAELIRARYSDAHLFRLTGKRASPAYVLPKLLWLRHHRPELFQRTATFLMAHDYLLFKLSGQLVTDHSMAGGTLLYDIARLGWSPELTAAFDISEEQLPRIEWSGACLGPIKADIAESLDLGKDVIVAVGGQDQKCAALGAHIRPGVATVSLGTASAISCLVDHPLLDRARRIPTFPFVVSGYWDLEGVVGTAGGAYRWLRETLFPAMEYAALDAMANQAPVGANGVCFYPHLSGAGSPHWRADVWGAFLGLTLAAGCGDIVRSVLEGVAFQIRANLEVMKELGITIDELILFGGGAHSALWSQIICDVTRKPLSITAMVDVANWGACLLAGIGAGLFDRSDFLRSEARVQRPQRFPRPEVAEQYDGIYQLYRTHEEQLLVKTALQAGGG